MDNASFNKILIRYCLRLTSAVLIGQQIECKQFVHGFLKCITFLNVTKYSYIGGIMFVIYLTW